MNKVIKVAILTQDDSLVIPRNINKINALENIRIEIVVCIKSKGALAQKKMMFVKGFGLFQSFIGNKNYY